MSNQALIAGVLGAVIAQLIKFFTLLIRERRIDVRTLVTTGGMPSSHTALGGWASRPPSACSKGSTR
jgi:Uncharacterized protein conserved in bacteria